MLLKTLNTKKPALNMQKVIRFLKYPILILVMFCALESKAQNACTQTLRIARTVFDEGRIHELETLLDGCIKNGFTDEERTEAYRLLILAHIYLDETEKADQRMLELLKDNHGYKTQNDVDPVELIDLYNTFRHDPIFFWGFRGGFNTTFVNVIKAYGLHDLNNTSASYSNRIGFNAGLLFEKNFGKRIAARADLQYANNTFDYNNTFLRQSTTGATLVTLTATEVQSSVGLSLMAHYRLFREKDDKYKKWYEKPNPYIGLGGSAFNMLGSEMTFDESNNAGASPDGPAEDLIKAEIRKTLNPTIDIEIGIKKKSGLNYINAGFRYSYGILDITDKHYDNGRLSTFYGFAANDINTHSLSIFVGYLIPKYSPKKLTK